MAASRCRHRRIAATAIRICHRPTAARPRIKVRAPNDPEHALISVGEWLAELGYEFTTITPESHRRVRARADRKLARSVRDVFGWSLPFERTLLPAHIVDALRTGGVLEDHGEHLRSLIRLSSLRGRLYVHSAYPTDHEHAVFFGPDTYRFCAALAQTVPRARRQARAVHRLADPGRRRSHPQGGGAVALAHQVALPRARSRRVRGGARDRDLREGGPDRRGAADRRDLAPRPNAELICSARRWAGHGSQHAPPGPSRSSSRSATRPSPPTRRVRASSRGSGLVRWKISASESPRRDSGIARRATATGRRSSPTCGRSANGSRARVSRSRTGTASCNASTTRWCRASSRRALTSPDSSQRSCWCSATTISVRSP